MEERVEEIFAEECRHLEAMQKLLKTALDKSIETVGRHDQDYRDSKRYMAEYRHEIDPREIFQNELLLKDIERSGMIAVQERDRLRKLYESPYFSRIDFREDGEEEDETYYIGRFTFTQGHRIQVYDWRAPVAGMFYEYELGPAEYDAPMGRIAGFINGKRQFKIADGRLIYAIENAAGIRDEVLQRELSTVSDDKMKTIIASLQREQNQVIRNDKAETMIIQGVAGSGKTSVALHRIAYLLYRHKDTLAAGKVVILSPNKVFGDYIAGVLPELGEEPIYEMNLEEIAGIQLEGVISFEADKNPLELSEPDWSERMRYKTTLDFIIQLDEYIDESQNALFCPEDCIWGVFEVTGEWIANRFRAYHRYPVKRRLEEIAGDIYERFTGENFRGEELPPKGEIRKRLFGLLRFTNTLDLYREFYEYIGHPELFVMPRKKTLEWMDVYPFLYLHAYFSGVKENQRIKHLVVDEMQDYTPMQYEVLNLLFRCKKTILGDFGQAVNPHNRNSIENMVMIYPDSELIRLNKSYRSSYEIIRFAAGILKVAELEPVERHGSVPRVIECRDEMGQAARVRELIAAFKRSGFTTLGVIAKTDVQARHWYELLGHDLGIHLITSESRQFQKGVTITSVKMAKGLEFDEAVILTADQSVYQSEFDRNLLYIACTRAMHKLTLLYCGERTELIS